MKISQIQEMIRVTNNITGKNLRMRAVPFKPGRNRKRHISTYLTVQAM